MNEINAWLDSNVHDHNKGIELLRRVAKNKYLVRSLSLKNNNYNRAKLFYELSKYRSHLQETAPFIPGESKPAKQEIKKVAPVKPAIDLNNMTDDETKAAVEKLEIGLSKMHNKRGILSNSLRSFDGADNDGRKKVMDQIDGLNQDMQQIRDKLNYYQKHGKLPPVPEKKPDKNIFDDIPDDPVAMNKMLLNERSNVSKYKKKMKENIVEEHRAKIEKRLSDSISVIAEIEMRLNGR